MPLKVEENFIQLESSETLFDAMEESSVDNDQSSSFICPNTTFQSRCLKRQKTAASTVMRTPIFRNLDSCFEGTSNEMVAFKTKKKDS